MLQGLDRALTAAVKETPRGTGIPESVGILFSGGIDSSLLAKICEELGKDATLYSVAMKGSNDLAYLEEISSFFKPVITKVHAWDIEYYAAKVLSILKNWRVMQAEICIPTYIGCETAKEHGEKALLSGQGADELFAGYHRYLDVPINELQKVLERDLKKCIADTEIYSQIAKANSVDLECPYLNKKVIDVAGDIPAEMKVKDGVRKFILREIARKRGLPEVIINMEKKAMQYSTGVDKALRKIAKSRNKSLEEYLNSLAGV